MGSEFKWSRRTFIIGSASLMALAGCESTPEISTDDAVAQLRQLEIQSGGRLGVSAMNMKRGLQVTHRGDERFAMCSTFKWVLAYFMVNETDWAGLERQIPYTREDIVSWSPITEPMLVNGKASLTLYQLCVAAVQNSDNTASNLLLKEIGGPEGFNERLRKYGDNVTRLDRWEPQLNENKIGDPRDTTTPNAMTDLLSKTLFGKNYGRNENALVREMMMGAETGLNRLRAGLPQEFWVVGDKTGTSENNQSNDVAFAFTFPTNYTGMKGPILISSYLNVDNPTSPETDKLHQEIARICMKGLA